MKTKMTLGGIGPKLMLLCLPYIILALSVGFKYPEFLNIEYFDHLVFKNLGLFWLVAGFAFWISSVIIFLTDFKTRKLITRGTFGWCRNPVYASLIIFILPAFALIYHSGLIASIVLVFYIGFKISIHGENILLERTFGNEYEIYKQSVNEILPFPRFIFKKIATTAKEKHHEKPI
jgi:protein-S-isoprenylcysteine O-methyltransferase Ste14